MGGSTRSLVSQSVTTVLYFLLSLSLPLSSLLAFQFFLGPQDRPVVLSPSSFALFHFSLSLRSPRSFFSASPPPPPSPCLGLFPLLILSSFRSAPDDSIVDKDNQFFPSKLVPSLSPNSAPLPFA